MKDLVADLKLCKELKEYVKLDTEFIWIKPGKKYEVKLTPLRMGEYDLLEAPTAGELLRKLPENTGIYRKNEEWVCYNSQFTNETPSALEKFIDLKPENALIKMLIYLYKEKLL